MSQIRISVITICLNAAEELPRTIESVLAQDFCDIEYIIKDGGSTDDTNAVIDGYRKKFSEKGIEFKVINEPDTGIYDAMNQGVRQSVGEYINFMNAGDCFYSEHVLSDIAAAISSTSADIIYGDCAVYEYGRFFKFPKSIERIEHAMPFSHQSCFARASFLREHPFDTGYRYSADYDFLLTAHDLKASFADAGVTVCITTADGVSSLRHRDTMMETALILKNHGINVSTDKMLRIKQFVLDHFPVCVKKYIRGRQIKKRGQSFDALTPPWFVI